ncbi:hypothetical protein BD769DRAFT_1674438 [Suillus cothurnatus]|nr:hypothetical protein BD769DRAFT_1674438 [Suillus cothurnatus]
MPLTFGLTTPANFFEPGEASEPPPLPSGSHLALGPAQIPLPDSPDTDLCDPWRLLELMDMRLLSELLAHVTRLHPKRAHAAEGNEDDPRAGAKRGWPSGSSNYSPADIQVLLDFVEDESPLGQKGWQMIHLKYSEWARSQGCCRDSYFYGRIMGIFMQAVHLSFA